MSECVQDCGVGREESTLSAQPKPRLFVLFQAQTGLEHVACGTSLCSTTRFVRQHGFVLPSEADAADVVWRITDGSVTDSL